MDNYYFWEKIEIEKASSLQVKTGNYLLALDSLKNSYFEDCVIYLASCSQDEGVCGFIINRQTHMPIAEVFSGLPKSAWKNITLFLGGPVSQDEVQILKLEAEAGVDNSSYQMKENLQEEAIFLDQILGEPSTKLFLGYSGWSYDQLLDELEKGFWEITDTLDPLFLFKEPESSYQIPSKEFKQQFC